MRASGRVLSVDTPENWTERKELLCSLLIVSKESFLGCQVFDSANEVMDILDMDFGTCNVIVCNSFSIVL